MIRALTWNLFHGRDFPPDPALRTFRSRLLRVTERNETHAQVNRDLYDEFESVIAGIDWDVALFQECPPHWASQLATTFDCDWFRVATSRNSLAPLRRAAAALNPDLIGSNEGGSNLILSRIGELTDRRELVVAPRLVPGTKWNHSGLCLAPERRVLGFARVGGVCVANLHASTGAARRALAEDEIRRAAAQSVEWAAGAPLIFGGDLNVRPAQSNIYDEMAERHSLAAPTADKSIDHLLVRGLETVQAPNTLPAESREVAGPGGLRLRLSDHAPVQAVFALPAG